MASLIRVADYIVKTLADNAVDTAFLVTGGMAMHVNDALAGEPRIRPICCHHEQAAAFAAEGYAHIAGKPALVSVTAGPGAINALTGVFSAYVDSMPMLVIAGQARTELMRSTYQFGHSMRQIGEQEVDSVSMAYPVAKYACRVIDPKRIRFELEKALFIATQGRPGPCWLEVPLDVQAAMVDAEALVPFKGQGDIQPDLNPIITKLVNRWQEAKRPIMVVGPGVREATAVGELERVAENLGCPLLGAGPQDAVTTDHPQYAGKIGSLGTRAGNINLQNADLILFVGMRTYLSQVTYNWRALGRNAYKIFVDEDAAEFEKPCCVADEPIIAGAAPFLKTLASATGSFDRSRHEQWLRDCRSRVALFPPVGDTMRTVTEDGRINPYWFMEELCKRLRNDDAVAACNASASILPIQAGDSVRGQRFFSNLGCGAMGFALPAAIGAAAANEAKRVVCLVGDGSLMMNIQELQTIKHHGFPILAVVLDNNGYVSIRHTQRNFFGRMIGCDPDSGVSFPDIAKVAESFGLPSMTIAGPDFIKQIDAALSNGGPMVVVAKIDPAQGFEPKVASRRLEDGRMVSSPPEDMTPFLPREELNKHLIHPLEDER